MDKLIGYNHTFSNINIKPAFVDAEIVGSTIFYSYYFLLYPTGLAIVLAVPYELSSVSYNPTTNYFTTADSLSYGMVKLASITPKIYQFVGASQILVTAGSGSDTRSNTGANSHYKGFYTTPNPISLNTSTKRIVGQGTEYGSLPEMLFIDPALGMGQALSTNSVDTVRYPLYKKNNLYYKSTTTLDTDAQYLSVAGDAFSHSGTLSNLSQDGTKGYASRNELGILLNIFTPNPQVPSSNNAFSQATTANDTKDIYQTDYSRFMTEKFGIKDGNNGYQLSVAPNISDTGGYYLGSESQLRVPYPVTNRSRSNPGILYNSQDSGPINVSQEVFFIDQFVLQVRHSQFKIPVGGTVRHYNRTAGTINKNTALNYLIPSSAGQDKYFGYTGVAALGNAGVHFGWGDAYGNFPPITINIPSPSAFEEIYNRATNQGNSVTLNGNYLTESDSTDIKRTYSIPMKIDDQGITIMGKDSSGSTDYINYKVVYNISNIPLIPGISINNIDGNSSTSLYTSESYPDRASDILGASSEVRKTDSLLLRVYRQRKQQTIGETYKLVLSLENTIHSSDGIYPQFEGTVIENPDNLDLTLYSNASGSSTFSYRADRASSNNGNQAGLNARVKSDVNSNVLDIIVAYPG